MPGKGIEQSVWAIEPSELSEKIKRKMIELRPSETAIGTPIKSRQTTIEKRNRTSMAHSSRSVLAEASLTMSSASWLAMIMSVSPVTTFHPACRNRRVRRNSPIGRAA